MISTRSLGALFLAALSSFLLVACPGKPATYPKEITGPLGIEFVLIPKGSFLMGCVATEDDCDESSRPRHKVTISQSFYLSKYEITQAQWKAFSTIDLNESSDLKQLSDLKQPVSIESWPLVVFFISSINNANGTTKYRLPTEAEWEYAARAGSATKYWFGDDSSQLDGFAWYRDNSSKQPHPVGEKKPNPWGLYDMYGNVAELVSDLSERKYQDIEQTDPFGAANLPVVKESFVVITRGGGCDDEAGLLSSSKRNIIKLNFVPKLENTGFRLAFTPDEHDLR
jgi:formylglycine-generating enzyme required for sulfatase activity